MQNSSDAIPIFIMLAIVGIVFLVVLAIQALISYLLYRACASIPQNFRLTSPGAAFILMIPLVGVVWVFIYTKNLSQSFVNLFNSFGGSRDDCGEKLGLWWGICSVCSVIPFIGGLAGIAAFVLMVMYIVKVNECRSMALNGPGNFGPGPMGAAAPYKTPGSPQNPYGY